ncbi:MAG: flagellar basal body L-ring protein FlgH [Deltaproteobacteria bacterium]|nr:flagellar basal body L-ring protein FlgH [Deltaproteobacteria bacterium]MBW2338786.1 flagellar basal body L-ring protein FlgH [Deltaproteobacteria bacterium]
MVTKSYCVLCILFIFFTGCALFPTNTSHVFELKRIQEPQFPEYAHPVVEEGSLWSDARGIMLYPDRRATMVGDVVTVRIVEDPEAQLNANTKTSRSSSIDAKLKFLGYMQALADRNSRLAQNPGEDDLIKAGLGMSFDGKGSSDRDGHVKAYVSAMVVKVLPNENLFIQGKREIKVNNETQYIALSGIIRPEDISPNNEISSTYVANAKITYSGIGPLADKQKPGWLGRIVDHVWPF